MIFEMMRFQIGMAIFSARIDASINIILPACRMGWPQNFKADDDCFTAMKTVITLLRPRYFKKLPAAGFIMSHGDILSQRINAGHAAAYVYGAWFLDRLIDSGFRWLWLGSFPKEAILAPPAISWNTACEVYREYARQRKLHIAWCWREPFYILFTYFLGQQPPRKNSRAEHILPRDAICHDAWPYRHSEIGKYSE